MKIVVLSFVTFLTVGVSTFAIMNRDWVSEFVQRTPDAKQPTEEVVATPDFEQPFVMLAMNSPSRLMSDFQYIASKSRIEDFKGLTDFVEPYLDVLDSTKPMGLMVYAGTKDLEFVACLPISDITGLKKLLDGYGSVTECALGLVFKPVFGGKYMIKQVGDYAFVTATRERLNDLPSEPAGLLQASVSKNTAALTIDMKKLPKLIKDAGSQGFQNGLHRHSYGASAAGVLSGIEKTVDDLIYDSEKISYYFNVDQQTNSVSLESSIVSNQGSLISDAAAANLSMGPSMFGGFQNDINSAMRFHWRSATMGSYFAALKADAVNSIGKAREQTGQDYKGDPEEEAIALELEKMLDDTIASNRLDVAANLFFKDGKENLLVAIHINDTTPLREFYESAIVNEKVKFIPNVDQHNDVVFHEMIGESSPDMVGIYQPLTAELSRKFTIGIGDQAVYLAMGRDSLETLKQCVSDSANSTNDKAQSSLEFNFQPLFGLNDGTIPADFVDTILEAFKDGDQLAIKCNSIEQGFSSQVKLDMGVVVASLKAVEMVGAVSDVHFSNAASPSKNVRVPHTRRPATNRTLLHDEQALREFEKGFQEGLEKSLKRQGYQATPVYGNSRIKNPYTN